MSWGVEPIVVNADFDLNPFENESGIRSAALNTSPVGEYIERTMEWCDRLAVAHNWVVDDISDPLINDDGFNWYRWNPNKENFVPKSGEPFELPGYPWNVIEFWDNFRDIYSFMNRRALFKKPDEYTANLAIWDPVNVSGMRDFGKIKKEQFLQNVIEGNSGLLSELHFFGARKQGAAVGDITFDDGGNNVVSGQLAVNQTNTNAFTNYQNSNWVITPGANLVQDETIYRVDGKNPGAGDWGVNDIRVTYTTQFRYSIFPVSRRAMANSGDGAYSFQSITGIPSGTIDSIARYRKQDGFSTRLIDLEWFLQYNWNYWNKTHKLAVGFIETSGLRFGTTIGPDFVDLNGHISQFAGTLDTGLGGAPNAVDNISELIANKLIANDYTTIAEFPIVEPDSGNLLGICANGILEGEFDTTSNSILAWSPKLSIPLISFENISKTIPNGSILFMASFLDPLLIPSMVPLVFPISSGLSAPVCSGVFDVKDANDQLVERYGVTWFQFLGKDQDNKTNYHFGDWRINTGSPNPSNFGLGNIHYNESVWVPRTTGLVTIDE